jgi:hypothetical protein
MTSRGCQKRHRPNITSAILKLSTLLRSVSDFLLQTAFGISAFWGEPGVDRLESRWRGSDDLFYR